MGQIKNIKLHIVTDIKWTNKLRNNHQTQPVSHNNNNKKWAPTFKLETTPRATFSSRYHLKRMEHCFSHLLLHSTREQQGCDFKASRELGGDVESRAMLSTLRLMVGVLVRITLLNLHLNVLLKKKVQMVERRRKLVKKRKSLIVMMSSSIH